MHNKSLVHREDGYVLITAIMLLFVATVLGLMVSGSSLTEVVLSGAQQRYEDDFNTTEGAAMAEATAVGTSSSISRNGSERSYTVVNPAAHNVILSPANSSTDPLFDPGNDMSLTGTIVVSLTSPETPPESWPMDNLLHSDADTDDRFDYHYRVVYSHPGGAPKGYDATKFSGYYFEISAQRSTRIDMGGNKIGPKMNL